MDAIAKRHDLPERRSDLTKELVREIAMDIGKAVVAYIEVMYPAAIKATPSTFKLSVRNSIHNEIMAALETTDEGEIRARLDERKRWRRKWVGAYRKMRAQDRSKAKEGG